MVGNLFHRTDPFFVQEKIQKIIDRSCKTALLQYKLKDFLSIFNREHRARYNHLEFFIIVIEFRKTPQVSAILLKMTILVTQAH